MTGVIRSAAFTVLFYISCFWVCLIGQVALLFKDRKYAMMVVSVFVGSVYFLEKHVLRLDYEVRGKEHLPEEGAYIIAAKHQSPYETLKLFHLFGDPVIVLKQELFKIPLYGPLLKKSEPIGIDRSQGRQSLKQIISGVKRAKAEGRPLVIYPQGTRVRIHETPEDKPYKAGVAHLYKTANLPVIPMAVNSGHFWTRDGGRKYGGTVIFQLLPPIAPGKDTDEFMKELETVLETASNALPGRED